MNLFSCPFCGGAADPEGWLDGDGRRGPECNDCGATAQSIAAWQRRAAVLPVPDVLAVETKPVVRPLTPEELQHIRKEILGAEQARAWDEATDAMARQVMRLFASGVVEVVLVAGGREIGTLRADGQETGLLRGDDQQRPVRPQGHP